MINVIEGLGINEVVFKAIAKLKVDGIRTNTRNGYAIQLYNNVFNIKQPKNRHLYLKGRLNNIFATIAETFWVMSGSINLKFLSFFLPRAYDFSDDGENWYGGYGGRLYNSLNTGRNQIKHVFFMFEKDNKYTRRASLYIGNVDDNIDAWQEHGFEGLAKDQACNQVLNFYIDGMNKFNVNVFQRSGDILWGLGSVNIFEWSYLMEWLYLAIKYYFYSDIELGEYYHFVTNAHLYDFNGKKQSEAILANKNEQLFGLINDRQLLVIDEFFDGSILFTNEWPNYFRQVHIDIVKALENIVYYDDSAKTKPLQDRLKLADELLGYVFVYLNGKDYINLRSDWLITEYIKLVSAYAIAKKLALYEKTNDGDKIKHWSISLNRLPYNDEFDMAIKNSTFRNFKIEFKDGTIWD